MRSPDHAAQVCPIAFLYVQVVSEWDGNNATVIVTGCSGGLGLESVRVLAARGADVIMWVEEGHNKSSNVTFQI